MFQFFVRVGAVAVLNGVSIGRRTENERQDSEEVQLRRVSVKV